MESIDFWTPDPYLRKTSTYSNSGMDRVQRKNSIEEAAELVGKRSMIKKVILTGTLEEISKLIESDIALLVAVYPEISLQTELLFLSETLISEGPIQVVKIIREKYSELKSEEVLLHENTEILHLTVAQLVSHLLLCRESERLRSLFDTNHLRIALWEKVNSSILSRQKVNPEQNDYLAVSCLDVINGHFDFLKNILKDRNDSCHRLAEKPQDFRVLSSAFSTPKPK